MDVQWICWYCVFCWDDLLKRILFSVLIGVWCPCSFLNWIVDFAERWYKKNDPPFPPFQIKCCIFGQIWYRYLDALYSCSVCFCIFNTCDVRRLLELRKFPMPKNWQLGRTANSAANISATLNLTDHSIWQAIIAANLRKAGLPPFTSLYDHRGTDAQITPLVI